MVCQLVCQDMPAAIFKKLCDFGSRYVRFEVLPYRSLYPDASKEEYLTGYVGSVYCTVHSGVWSCIETDFVYCNVTVTGSIPQRKSYGLFLSKLSVFVIFFHCLVKILVTRKVLASRNFRTWKLLETGQNPGKPWKKSWNLDLKYFFLVFSDESI